MSREELIKLGISEYAIDLYIKTKQITIENDRVILSSDLLVRLFLDSLKKSKNSALLLKSLSDDEETRNYITLLENLYLGNLRDAKINLSVIKSKYPNNRYSDVTNLYNFLLNGENTQEFSLVYEDNEYIGFYIKLVKKYLLLEQYAIVASLLEEILKIDDNIYLQILYRVCLSLPSKTQYIVDESKIKDPATRLGIAKMERAMLISLEKGESLILSKNFNNLVSFDICSDVYKNIVDLFNMADYFRSNYRKISNRDLRALYGDLDSVVASLIGCQDFYRLKSVLDEYQKDHKEFSIKTQMYKILIDTIMFYNKRNKGFIDRERSASLNKNNEKMLMERYPVSSISVASIEDEVFSMTTDFSKNYFEVYQNFFKSKKYKEAKRALLQFKVNMSSLDVFMNYDYLLKELEILIENMDDPNHDLVDELLALGDKETDKSKAIDYYLQALTQQMVKNPRIMSKIALCYYDLHDYIQASNYFKEADKIFMYPEDYIKMMESLIYTKQYNEVSMIARKYDTYYPEENAYVYYLLSIAYVNLGYLDLADDALNTADAINVAIYNMPIEYAYEHEVIKSLKSGISTEVYTINDFVSYDLTDKEKEFLGYVDDLKDEDQDNYFALVKKEALTKQTISDKIDYLLMAIKVFNYKEEGKHVDELITLVSNIMRDNNLPDNIEEDAKKILRLYKLD